MVRIEEFGDYIVCTDNPDECSLKDAKEELVGRLMKVVEKSKFIVRPTNADDPLTTYTVGLKIRVFIEYPDLEATMVLHPPGTVLYCVDNPKVMLKVISTPSKLDGYMWLSNSSEGPNATAIMRDQIGYRYFIKSKNAEKMRQFMDALTEQGIKPLG